MTHITLVVVTVLLIAFPAHALDGGVRQAGYVSRLAGERGGYIATFRGAARPLALLDPVFEGDMIDVRRPGGILMIRMGNGKDVTVTSDRSPYRVRYDGASPSLGGAILEWVAGVVNGAHDQYAVPVSGRGRPLGAPLFDVDAGLPRMIGGVDRLHIGWTGGKPPYAVAVKRRGATLATLTVPNDQRTTLVFGGSSLAPGNYVLSIRDAAGQEYVAGFVAEPQGTINPPPADSIAEPDVRVLADALAVTGVNGDAWRLESYQRLSRIEHFGLASDVAHQLAEGYRVPLLADGAARSAK